MMKFLTDQQFERLSKAAQQEIKLLERRLTEANSRNAELVAALPIEGVREQFKPAPEKLIVDTFAHRLIFPQDTSVEFGLGGGNYVNICFVEGKLRVRGNTSLRIAPEASNALALWVE